MNNTTRKQIEGIVSLQSSGYFFTNKKTDVAVDFHFCSLMQIDKEGKISAPLCAGCYSATLLNIFGGARKKILSLPKQDQSKLEAFEKDCKKIKEGFDFFLGGLEKLRFYALGDFQETDIPYIEVASKFFVVDIISKALVFPHNEKHLISLFNKKNVWVSLSFNKDFIKEKSRIFSLLRKHKPCNVQTNYTLNYKNEDPNNFSEFQVLHVKNKKKRGILEMGVPKERVCGMWDRSGNEILEKGGDSCKACDNCHQPFISPEPLYI